MQGPRCHADRLVAPMGLGGRGSLQGALALEAQDLASRLSTLRPLGSYRMDLSTDAEGRNTAPAIAVAALQAIADL